MWDILYIGSLLGLTILLELLCFSCTAEGMTPLTYQNKLLFQVDLSPPICFICDKSQEVNNL